MFYVRSRDEQSTSYKSKEKAQKPNQTGFSALKTKKKKPIAAAKAVESEQEQEQQRVLSYDDDEMNLNDENATQTSSKAGYALERAHIVVAPSPSCIFASAHGDSDDETNPKRSSFECAICGENVQSRSEIYGHLDSIHAPPSLSSPSPLQEDSEIKNVDLTLTPEENAMEDMLLAIKRSELDTKQLKEQLKIKLNQ